MIKEHLLWNVQLRIDNMKRSYEYLLYDIKRMSIMIEEIRNGFRGDIIELDQKIELVMKNKQKA